MEKIRVNLKISEDKSYDILIGEDLLRRIPWEIKESGLAYKFAIVTDSTVEGLYGNALLEEFERAGLDTHIIAFPAGEKQKSRETKARIEDHMLENKFGRDSAVVALGGGGGRYSGIRRSHIHARHPVHPGPDHARRMRRQLDRREDRRRHPAR